MNTYLEENTPAPDFTAPDQTGATVSLKDYLGAKVVLYFYPEDDSPTCTKEACNLRDNYQSLLNAGYKVIGVSPDGVEAHQAFSAKYNLPFPLLADPDKKIMEAYGAWGEKNMFGKKVEGVLRITYIIDEAGVIKRLFKSIQSEKQAAKILALKL